MEHQRTALKLYEDLLNGINNASPWKKFVDGALQYAREHAEIISKFGRYPHRNSILSRESTSDELEFMKGHKGF